MRYYTENSLDNFEAWSGGNDTLETLRKNGEVESVECLINEVFCDEIPSETQINDFLWFERDTIAKHLGYSSWDEYEYGESNDEEEEN